MSRRRKTQWGETATDNNVSYLYYFNRLKELAISMFEWKNLPDSCDERFLEVTLFDDGQAVFFKDEELGGLLNLQVLTTGKFDVYRIPTIRQAFANNGYHRELTPDDSVIVYNNRLRTNSKGVVSKFAKQLWDLDRAIDVNAKAQKTPVLLLGNEQQQLSLHNIYMKYDGNEPVIYGDKSLDKEVLRVLNTEAPYVADKLYMLKTQIWNEAMTYLGISNLNIQKKERLVADEVTRNLGGTIASRYSRLESRRKAAEEINKMFGTNIEVWYREDYREQDDEVMLRNSIDRPQDIDIMRDLRTR